MRTHTAMHILCGVIFRDYGASVTGGNMELLKGRMGRIRVTDYKSKGKINKRIEVVVE